MILRRNSFGQLEVAPTTAAGSVPSPSPFTFYFVAVAAGVTVYLITRWLGRGKN
jgi:hypothetical protein